MATATLPTDTLVSTPSSSPPRLSLEPPGDVLYEVVNGRIVEPPPMGSYESELAFSLAVALDHVVSEKRLGKVVVERLFLIDVEQNLKPRPDLAFVSAARWPFGKRVPEGEAWDMVPDLNGTSCSPNSR
jgi:Uma2 family endonuclease